MVVASVVSLSGCDFLAEKNKNEVLDAFKKINTRIDTPNRAARLQQDALLLMAMQKFPSHKKELSEILKGSKQ